MRLHDFRWIPYALPFHRPFPTAWGTLESREGFLVGVRDAEGRWGIGEAAPLPGFGTETTGETQRRLEEWERMLPGSEIEPFDPPGGKSAPDPAPGSFGGKLAAWARNTPAAAHALETAWLSLTAEEAGLSLAKWMHPESPDGVLVNATLAARSLAETVEQARQAVMAGFSTLKIKVGADSPEEDWARLHAVREKVGGNTALRADANGAWEVERASAMLARWRDLELEYIEQPLRADDLSGMARLKADGNVPIAADESVNSEEGARRVLDHRAADLLVLKPMVLGGVLPALRIARSALARGVRVVVTSSLEGVFGRTASLHLAAAVSGAHAEAGLGGNPPACGLATGGLLAADLLDHPPEPQSGRLALPKGAGLGLPVPGRPFD